MLWLDGQLLGERFRGDPAPGADFVAVHPGLRPRELAHEDVAMLPFRAEVLEPGVVGEGVKGPQSAGQAELLGGAAMRRLFNGFPGPWMATAAIGPIARPEALALGPPLQQHFPALIEDKDRKSPVQKSVPVVAGGFIKDALGLIVFVHQDEGVGLGGHDRIGDGLRGHGIFSDRKKCQARITRALAAPKNREGEGGAGKVWGEDRAMHFGIYGINQGAAAEPEVAVGLAQLAEELGFDSLWTAGDLALPDPKPHPYAAAPATPVVHPALCLGALAEHTDHLLLVLGASEGCAQDALLWAKLGASLDHWSDGRGQLLLPPGFAVDAGQGLEAEWLEALRSLWGSDVPAVEGRFHPLSNLQAAPRPIQGARLPLWVQGRSAVAVRTALQAGQGWLCPGEDLETVAEGMAMLAEEEARSERSSALGLLEVSVLAGALPSPEDLEAYEELGVDRLVLRLPPDRAQVLEAFLEDVAEAYFDDFLDEPEG